MATPGLAVPRDWTGGTGVIPTSGTITVTAEPDRNSIWIQSQSTANIVSVLLEATIPNTGPADTGDTFETSTTATINVVGFTGAGSGSSTLSLGAALGFFTTGQFQVVGAATTPVVVLTT